MVAWKFDLDYQSPVLRSYAVNNEFGAGLRISAIKNDAITKTYHYPIGKYLTEPVLYYFGNRVGDGVSGAKQEQCLVQISESKTPLSTFNGGYFVGYDWVEENIGGNDSPLQITHSFMNEPETEKFDDSFIESPVIINYTNGLPRTKVYRSGGQRLKTEIFDYSETCSDYIYAFIDRIGNYSTGNVLNYYYKVQWPQMCSKEEIWDYNDEDDEIGIVESYSYNSYGLLSKVSKTIDGDSYLTQVKYPFDFQNAVCNAMVNKNFFNEPMEILELKNGYVINGQKKEYVDTLDMFLVKAAYRLNVAQPLSLSTYQTAYYKFKTFDKYDGYGNLVQYTENGIPIVYIWGYGGQYPIAEIRNSRYPIVYSLLGGESAVLLFGNKSSLVESDVKAFFAPLSNGRLGSAHVSLYTHIPMIGVQSITTPLGYTTNYEYDLGNRLNSIKNTEGQILQRFTYHYWYKDD